MTDTDLDSLSLKELKQLRKDIEKAIVSFEDRQKAEARSKVEELARELGFNLTELAGVEVKKTRAPAQPKYRHPENSSLTWSGRGRKPQWYVDAIASGKTAEDLAI